MRKTPWREQLWVGCAVGVAVLLHCLGGHGRVGPTKGHAAGDNPGSALPKLYFGYSECARCHTAPLPNDPDILLCRCKEVPIWEKQDKHKDAYRVLLQPGGRGQQIIKLLHYNEKDLQTNCVPCHGIRIENEKSRHSSLQRPEDLVNNGVSCVVCHGPHEEWVQRHWLNRKEWRQIPREEKESKYGMTDLWDPAKRTKLCASCHIGDTTAGKVVTHAMYAAGHPPLPSFEIATFSNAMPRHWQYLKEKPPEAQKLLGYDPEELKKTKEQTRLVAIGGAVVLREAMNLLATQATEAEGHSLDLAQFDCYACHHDLKVPSWRQKRGYPGPPGRPQFRSWPLALIPLDLAEAGKGDSGSGPLATELHEDVVGLHAAFDARPFGKPDRVAAAARGLAQYSDRLASNLAAVPYYQYDQAAALRLLRQLVAAATSETPDYDSARQMAWALKIIYGELDPKPGHHAAIQDDLGQLDKELKLSLPSGQKGHILEELPQVLERINDYNPDRFEKIFGALSRQLRPE